MKLSLFHVAGLMQLISKMCPSLNPRKLHAMQEKWCRVDCVAWFSTHEQTFSLALCWVWISAVLKIVPYSKLLTNFQHELHCCSGGGNQDHIIIKPCCSQKYISNVASHPKVPELLQQVIHVDGEDAG